MAAIVLEHLDKTYPGGIRAVIDCTLDIADGEFLVLVGPSGCGKSTVLRLVAGLEEPTGGTIRIDGRVVNDLRAQDRNVAMVFQDYALYPHFTARRNLEFPLRMRNLDRQERAERVERVAAALDISALLDRLPKELSGGQRQRVAMGRALVREPAAFLMDEPLSNLDARLRVQVRAEIKALQHRTGTTTLYVTHDQVEAMTLGDRVAVLDRGRLQQVAPPRVLYERPANVFVAGFVGNPPMNLFPTRMAREGRQAVLTVGSQRVTIETPADVPEGVSLTAGVRPEGLRLMPAAEGALDAVVEHVENLGHETLVHLRIDTQPLIARVAGMAALVTGDRTRVGIEPGAVHLFDAQGAAIVTPG